MLLRHRRRQCGAELARIGAGRFEKTARARFAAVVMNGLDNHGREAVRIGDRHTRGGHRPVAVTPQDATSDT